MENQYLRAELSTAERARALSIFQTVLKTVRLDVRQWLICTAVALSIVLAAEIRKAVLRKTVAERPVAGP